MAKITSPRQARRKLKSRNKTNPTLYLVVGILVAVLSVAGTFSLSIAWAEWTEADRPSESPTGDMPPGPVWLQDEPISPDTYEYQEADIKVRRAGFGNNDPDSSYFVSTPSIVVKGSGYGTVINSGTITTDNNLDIKGGIGVWDGTSDYEYGTSGQVLSSTGSGLEWVDMIGGVGSVESIHDIDDVVDTACADNQVLKYNVTTSEWECAEDDDSGDDGDWTISDTDMYSGVMGNVGIGTTSPAQELHVNQVGSNADIRLTTGTSAYWDIAKRSDDHSLRFASGPSGGDRMTITASGNVGIGTSSPSVKLDVNGAARVEALTINDYKMPAADGGANQIMVTDGGGDISWQDLPAGEVTGIIVGSVETGRDGDLSGYAGANALCGTGEHMCTTQEVLKSINSGVDLSSYDGYYWVSGGVDFPSVDIDIADCDGWRSDSVDNGGLVWYFDSLGNYRTYVSFCNDATNKILCCN